MGTRLELVLTEARDASPRALARRLMPLIVPAAAADVLADFNVADHAGVRAMCVELTEGLDLDSLARELSRNGASALHLWYSDSTGEAGYSNFENGKEVGRGEARGNEPRLYLWIQEGLRRAFPTWGDLGPEDLLDIVYGPEAISEAFVLARAGVLLPEPEPYIPPPEEPHRPSVFDREFAWGKVPRRVLRGCLLLYGVIIVGSILWIVVWWAWETFRP